MMEFLVGLELQIGEASQEFQVRAQVLERFDEGS